MATANTLPDDAKALYAISLSNPQRRSRPSEVRFNHALERLNDSQAAILAEVMLDEVELEWCNEVSDHQRLGPRVAVAWRGVEMLGLYPDPRRDESFLLTTAVIVRKIIDGWAYTTNAALRECFAREMREWINHLNSKEVLAHLRQIFEQLGDQSKGMAVQFLADEWGHIQLMRMMGNAFNRFATTEDLYLVGAFVASFCSDRSREVRHLVQKQCVEYVQGMTAAAEAAVVLCQTLGHSNPQVVSPSEVLLKWSERVPRQSLSQVKENKKRFLENRAALLTPELWEDKLSSIVQVDLIFRLEIEGSPDQYEEVGSTCVGP